MWMNQRINICHCLLILNKLFWINFFVITISKIYSTDLGNVKYSYEVLKQRPFCKRPQLSKAESQSISLRSINELNFFLFFCLIIGHEFRSYGSPGYSPKLLWYHVFFSCCEFPAHMWVTTFALTNRPSVTSREGQTWRSESIFCQNGQKQKKTYPGNQLYWVDDSPTKNRFLVLYKVNVSWTYPPGFT